MVGAGADELGGTGAEGVGNVLVEGELLQVDGIQQRQHVESDIEGSFGVVHEIANHDITLAESAITGDQAKDFITEAGHGREGFDFLIGQPRRLQNGALNHLAAVADESAASLGTAFDGELNALRDGHASDLLEESLAAAGVGFGVRGGIGQGLVVAGNGGAAELLESVFLVGG